MIISEITKERILDLNCPWLVDGKLQFDSMEFTRERDHIRLLFLYKDEVVAHIEKDHVEWKVHDSITFILAELGNMKIRIES